ncbi:MAG: DUF167 domain-containing protein [candidate division NC10 bacterium]|nr:DUF167 domain-containing protein [candidate division NC10 bacterium]
MTGGRVPVVQDGPDVLLAVRVQPRASRNQLVIAGTRPGGGSPDCLTIRLTAPPVEGAANAACRAFLADILGIPQSRILVDRGETSRHKLLRLRNADAASVIARLQQTPAR